MRRGKEKSLRITGAQKKKKRGISRKEITEKKHVLS